MFRSRVCHFLLVYPALQLTLEEMHALVQGDPVDYIHSRWNALDSSQRAVFDALSYTELNLNPAGLHLVATARERRRPFAVFATNAVGAGTAHVGLFPRMARLNHACGASFNAVYAWQEEAGMLVVHAIRDIPKGTVSLSASRSTAPEPSLILRRDF